MEYQTQNRIRALIVDDEAGACDHLRNIILTRGGATIEIVGIAHDTTVAEKIVGAEKPDAVFLDIEMPGENAIQFLERMSPFNFSVIFVTAYDAYAVKAFRMNAVDYILKPISGDEVAAAIEKLRLSRYWNKVPEDAGHYRLMSEQLNGKSALKKMRLPSGNQLDIVDIGDLYYIEAQRAYCKINFRAGGRDKVITMSRTLTDYEEILPSDLFYRIHKSYLVNCQYITQLIRVPAPAVVLNNRITLPISRRRYVALLAFLSNNNFPQTSH